MKSVLILSVDKPGMGGGVSNYYALVRKYFASDRVDVEFYNTEKMKDFGLWSKIVKTIYNFSILMRIFSRYDLVVFNTSLDPKAVFRDGLFHLLAKRIFDRKTIVFFRGWNSQFEATINRRGQKIFKFVFNTDQALVLSNDFKAKLIEWGFSPSAIRLETTTYEDNCSILEKDLFKIIFLSRFVNNKGCLEAIKSIEMLKEKFPQIKLYMAGDGYLLSELKAYVKAKGLSDHVEFTGWLQEKEKYNLLSQCGIMLFPTSYGEGMPNSILQGMGLGLAIITRPVGGIPEIIRNDVNGFLIESMDPKDFSDKLSVLFENPEKWQSISRYNKEEAAGKYEIRVVVRRLEQLFFEMVSDEAIVASP